MSSTKTSEITSGRVIPGRKIAAGNEAVGDGALYAGLQAYFGYPITPATSLMEYIVKRFSKMNEPYAFLQAEDEIASITATIGASWTRRKAMTATSGPGFSLMQEGIGLAVFTETPLVILNVMRGGPSTGLPTFPGQQDLMQTHFGSHGDYMMPVFAPSTVQEAFDFTVEAFNASEALRTPVVVLSDQSLSALKEIYVVPKPGELEVVNRARPGETITWKGEEISPELVPPMNCFGEKGKAYCTGLSHDETGHVDLSPQTYNKLLKRLREKILRYEHLMPQPEVLLDDDAELILVAYGSAARAAKEATLKARKKGYPVGFFRPKTVWPFPEKQIQEVVGDREVLVVEMSMGQLIWPVERALARRVHHIPWYTGKVPAPHEILDRVFEILKKEA